MDGIVSFLVFLTTFWLAINILYRYFRGIFESHGFRLYYGLVLVYRRGFSLTRVPAALKKTTLVWLALFLYSLAVFYYAMYLSILSRLGVAESSARASLVVPGINLTGLPLVYFIAAVVVAASIHELLHALTAAVNGVPVKGLGFAIVGLVPLAFTEIDEDLFRKASLRVRSVILAAGPASNIALAFILLPLLSLIVSPATLAVVDVVPGSLADRYDVPQGSIIVLINGKPASLGELRRVFETNTTVNVTLTLLTPSGIIKNISFIKPGNVSKLGVYVINGPRPYIAHMIGVVPAIHLAGFIEYSFLVNYSLALINAAPLFITDGGRIVYESIRRRKISHMINTATLAITVLALTPLLG